MKLMKKIVVWLFWFIIWPIAALFPSQTPWLNFSERLFLMLEGLVWMAMCTFCFSLSLLVFCFMPFDCDVLVGISIGLSCGLASLCYYVHAYHFFLDEKLVKVDSIVEASSLSGQGPRTGEIKMPRTRIFIYWLVWFIIWPIAALFPSQTPDLRWWERILLLGSGLACLASLIFFGASLLLLPGFMSDPELSVCMAISLVAVMIFSYSYVSLFGSFVDWHSVCKKLLADNGKNIKPMSDSAAGSSQEKIKSEFKTKEEFRNTLERMARHAKKARIAWEAADHGAWTPV
jgi:hypothetical protein